MSTKRYRVRLVRPVFQVAIVEVAAVDEEDAMVEALSQAETISEREWRGAFDPDSYFYDAQYAEEAAGGEDDYIFTGIDQELKYLLLKGNTASGKGEVLFQPWLNEINDLLVADLGSDWSGPLHQLEEVGAASFYDSLEEQLRGKNTTPAKVLPFRRPDDSAPS